MPDRSTNSLNNTHTYNLKGWKSFYNTIYSGDDLLVYFKTFRWDEFLNKIGQGRQLKYNEIYITKYEENISFSSN